MSMQQVSLREANQHLSRYIDAVNQGQEITITKRGQPVARLLPVPKKRRLSTQQQKIWKRVLKRMQKGYHLGGEKFNRDEAHER